MNRKVKYVIRIVNFFLSNNNYYYLGYNVQNESELLSVNLRDPLSMEFPTEMCTLLLHNKTLLKKYGINLGSSKENTLFIRTIPQCLVTNNDPCNGEKILSKIRSLLNEVFKNRSTNQANVLPLIIHNAIASEACHGIRQIVSYNMHMYAIIHIIIIISKIHWINYESKITTSKRCGFNYFMYIIFLLEFFRRH